MYERIPSEFEAFYPDPLNLWLAFNVAPSTMESSSSSATSPTGALRLNPPGTTGHSSPSVQQTALVATWDIEYATGKVTYGPGLLSCLRPSPHRCPDYRSFNKIVLPEYIPIIAASIQSGLENGQMVVQDFQVRAADGQILWLESRGHAVMINGVPTRPPRPDHRHHRPQEKRRSSRRQRSPLSRPRRPQPSGHLDGRARMEASPTPIRASSTTSASPLKRSAAWAG